MFGCKFMRVPKGAWVDAYEAGVVDSILKLSHGRLDKLRTLVCRDIVRPHVMFTCLP